jgi:hypothetical protein
MATGTHPAALLDEPEAIDGDDPLRALIGTYATLLDRVEGAHAVTWPRHARWLAAPAPRGLVRLLTVRYVSRRVQALRRRSCVLAAMADPAAAPPSELTRLDYFERSLPAVRGMKLLAPLALLGVLLISYVFANHVVDAQSAELLGDLTTAAVELDRSAAVDAFDRHELAVQHFIGAAMFLTWSTVLLVVPVLPAFSVRRRLLREQTGIEQREARAFAELGARRVYDMELDLLVQLMLVGALWVWGAVGVSLPVTDPDEPDLVFLLSVGALVVAVTSVAGAELLRRYGRRRRGEPARRSRLMRVALQTVWVLYGFVVLAFIFGG